MNGKASESNALAEVAGFRLGLRDGSRRRCLEASGRGFDSPRVQAEQNFFPVGGCSRPQGMSSGMSQGQGWKPAVILALTPEESKGQNDMHKVLPCS